MKLLQSLKELSKKDTSLTLNELRVVLALERAVARLQSHSKLKKHLIFKGGFVLLKTTKTSRFTRDLDALADQIDQSTVKKLLPEALSANLEDGLWYGGFELQDLTDQGDYGGLRLRCAFQIGEAPKSPAQIKRLSRIHIDVGFGDVIKEAVTTKMTPILSETAPVSWRIYPLEYIFSEKLQTFFERGSANSRAKDLFDMTMLLSKKDISPRLLKAINSTFAKRGTPLPASFSKQAEAMDRTILRSAWKSVQIDEAISFEKIWKKFQQLLKELDK